MTLLECPLCCHESFLSVAALREKLLYIIHRQLKCVVCQETIGGIPKLIDHLEAHDLHSVSGLYNKPGGIAADISPAKAENLNITSVSNRNKPLAVKVFSDKFCESSKFKDLCSNDLIDRNRTCGLNQFENSISFIENDKFCSSLNKKEMCIKDGTSINSSITNANNNNSNNNNNENSSHPMPTISLFEELSNKHENTSLSIKESTIINTNNNVYTNCSNTVPGNNVTSSLIVLPYFVEDAAREITESSLLESNVTKSSPISNVNSSHIQLGDASADTLIDQTTSTNKPSSEVTKDFLCYSDNNCSSVLQPLEYNNNNNNFVINSDISLNEEKEHDHRVCNTNNVDSTVQSDVDFSNITESTYNYDFQGIRTHNNNFKLRNIQEDNPLSIHIDGDINDDMDRKEEHTYVHKKFHHDQDRSYNSDMTYIPNIQSVVLQNLNRDYGMGGVKSVTKQELIDNQSQGDSDEDHNESDIDSLNSDDDDIVKEEFDNLGISSVKDVSDIDAESSDNKSKPYKCDICFKDFAEKRYLKNHYQIHADGLLRCNVCNNYTCKTKSGLRTHKVEVHSNRSKQRFKCNHCSETFQKKYGLKRHVERKHKTVHITCDECNKLFTCFENYTTHIKSHNGKNLFKCKNCNKAFSHSWSLKRHEIIHISLPSNFKCSECNKSFTRKDSLIAHKRLH